MLISEFMRQMRALKASNAAIDFAVAEFERLQAERDAAQVALVQKDSERRQHERERKASQREHRRLNPKQQPQYVPGHSGDIPGTVAGQSPDPAPSPSLSPVPYPSRTPTRVPHTPGVPAHEGQQPQKQTAQGQGCDWPDLSEYPAVETVRQWAQAMSVEDACANKWHAINAAAFWENVGIGRPLPTAHNLLRPLFNSYAEKWKVNLVKEAKREKDIAIRRSPGGYTGSSKGGAFTTAQAEAGLTAAQLKGFGTRTPGGTGGPEQP